MPTLPVYNLEKNKVGSIELDDKIFAAEVEPKVIHQMVKYQRSQRYRIKPANSLTRTEVSGTTKKMYRQKGTGQARHGDEKAPIFVGGGKAHGPRPRVVNKSLNKQVKRKALISTLSMLQKSDRLFVVDKLELEKHSTKTVASSMNQFGLEKALVINHKEDNKERIFNKSTGNIRALKCVPPEGINVFDLLKFKHLVMSQKSGQDTNGAFKR